MAQDLQIVQDYLDRCREELHDANSINYTNPELMGYLNEVLLALWTQLESQAPWYVDATMATHKEYSLVKGQATYALPTDFAQERMVTIDGEKSDAIPLANVHNDDLAGHILYRKMIHVRPTPEAADAGKLMRLYYLAEPKPVEVVGDVIPLPKLFQQEIKNFMVAKARARNKEDPGFSVSALDLARQAVGRFVTGQNKPTGAGVTVAYRRYI